jgi:dTDP-4-amino-4,6-dideoxygalactose transaminase
VVHVIEQSGATPVLADVEPDTLNLDPIAVGRAMTARTRAIIPTHLYGHPAEIDALRALAEPRGLLLLEDAAHALPARHRGRTIGSTGSATAFSFYATKNLTTGDGGMLVGSPKLIESARIWSAQGMTRDAYGSLGDAKSWDYDVVVAGFKCNMTDIQAALGLQQLRRLDGFRRRRRSIAGRYQAALAALPEVQPPTERPHVESAWHLYPVRLNLARLSIDRAAFIEECRRRNISVSVHFKPIHLLYYYREKYGCRPADFPVAHDEYRRLVTLPLAPRMTDDDVDDVLEAVADVVAQHRR